MKLVQKYSPNHGPRPGDIDAVVLHCDASAHAAASVDWCCTPKPENPNPVSYHVIVDRDGTVFSLVDVKRRAWHAGVSRFAGRADVNDFSIGLSFANKNDGIEPYTDDQYAVAAALIAAWMIRYPKITLERITTHAVIRAAWRVDHPDAEEKHDPANFDMPRLKALVARELEELKAKSA